MKSTTTVKSDIADPILYRLYWSLMLNDILHKQGFDATKENKEKLHDFHKRILGYETISARTQDVVSRFIFEVCCYWSVEKGIFVRTSRNQPYDIEQRSLAEVWHLL
jgi:hypothetical protein